MFTINGNGFDTIQIALVTIVTKTSQIVCVGPDNIVGIYSIVVM
jgi:hypothetical protein